LREFLSEVETEGAQHALALAHFSQSPASPIDFMVANPDWISDPTPSLA
jgi:hypothetical protein